MKFNYQLIAKVMVGVFSIAWATVVLQAFFVVGFSPMMLQSPSFVIVLLGTLLVPIAAVWGLYFYLNK